MELTANTLITILQALQLVALVPCVFVVIYLLVNSHLKPIVIVPALYFLALAATFLPPLLQVWPDFTLDSATYRQVGNWLFFTHSTLPSLSFLLIMQLLLARIPRWYHWLILLVPVLGVGTLLWATQFLTQEICLGNAGCMPVESFQTLYSTVMNAFVLMLLVLEFSRNRHKFAQGQRAQWHNQYWLMMALIIFSLLVLAVDLAYVAERISATDASLTATILRMTFIYLVMTLLFRVFDREKGEISQHARLAEISERDHKIRDDFIRLMEEEHYYRDVHCSRETVARKLGVNENYLSRVMSHLMEKRFNDAVNHYRVEEAKRLLRADPKSSITTIAYEVGFNSIASFNRVFREMVRQSPTEYRQQVLAGEGG